MRPKYVFSFFFSLAAIAGLFISIIGKRVAAEEGSVEGIEEADEQAYQVGWSFTLIVILARLGISANFNLVYIVHC